MEHLPNDYRIGTGQDAANWPPFLRMCRGTLSKRALSEGCLEAAKSKKAPLGPAVAPACGRHSLNVYGKEKKSTCSRPAPQSCFAAPSAVKRTERCKARPESRSPARIAV